ncbi:hypothetical protein AB6A40_004213 [Gnathostoma spinigerum]|uniref:G-protein coupled receptors family 1 profile domain-containing protein n=1 Tax=Gnathostoma spinigerum TaxID=75299 RepID=A0ABD6EBT8_9BILA
MGIDITEPCILLNASQCCQTTLLGVEEKVLYIYLFPFLLIFSIFGNTMNVILYHHPFLRSSSTVRILMCRALANLFFSLSLIPNYIYSLGNGPRPPEQPYTVYETDTAEIFYWSTIKYVMFFVSFLNTTSVWLTVCVTCQLLGLIVWPFATKRTLSLKMSNCIIVVVVILSVLLHSQLLTHRLVLQEPCPQDSTIIVHRYLSTNKLIVDKLYYYVHAASVNIFPLLILVLCCIIMGCNLIERRRHSIVTSTFKKSTARSECVLSLAAATTVCHLIFEFPSPAVHVFAAFTFLLDSQCLILIAITNFLTILNASTTFIVYTAFSRRYRHLAMHICGCRGSHTQIPKDEPSLMKRRNLV